MLISQRAISLKKKKKILEWDLTIVPSSNISVHILNISHTICFKYICTLLYIIYRNIYNFIYIIYDVSLNSVILWANLLPKWLIRRNCVSHFDSQNRFENFSKMIKYVFINLTDEQMWITIIKYKFIKYIAFLLAIKEENSHHFYQEPLYEELCMFCLFIRISNDKAENENLLHINFHFVFNTSIKAIWV